MQREKFIEVYSKPMAYGPKYMRHMIISEDTHEGYWPVMGKFIIKAMIELGAEPKRYKGHNYVEMNWLANYYKENDFMYMVINWHLRLLHQYLETILKKEKVYSLELVDKEMKLVEYVAPNEMECKFDDLIAKQMFKKKQRDGSFKDFEKQIVRDIRTIVDGIILKQKREKDAKATK